MLVRQVPPFLQTLFSQDVMSSDPASGFSSARGLRVVMVVMVAMVVMVVRVVRVSVVVVLSGSEILVSPVSRVVFVMSKGGRGSSRNILCQLMEDGTGSQVH